MSFHCSPRYSFVELSSSRLDIYPTGRQLQLDSDRCLFCVCFLGSVKFWPRKLHCDEYVQSFSLLPFIRLGVEVEHLRQEPQGWSLTFNDGSSEAFDFVVLAVGNFNQKFLPEVPGSQHFMGRILHSSELVDAHLLRDHHVVVVGYGKSALVSW